MRESPKLRFGLTVKRAHRIEDWRALARKAEEFGYSTIHVGDHIRDQWAPLIALTAAADVTTTLRLGANVLNNDFRNPVVLAQEIATLDVVSGGRVEVGLGAGYNAADFEATGIRRDPAATRIERLREAVEIMKRYWRDGVVDYSGRHFSVARAAGHPRPFSTPWPRLCIGGGGRGVLTVAAEEADIVSIGPRLGRAGLTREAILGADEQAFAERVGWVRAAAGERFADIELHMSVLFGGIGARAEEVKARLMHEHGLSESEVRSLPIVLIGSVGEVCDRIVELKARFGITYFSLNDLHGFAPVVERLAGRPLTPRNVLVRLARPLLAPLETARQRLRPPPPEPEHRRHKVLLLGAGGMGEIWIRKHLPRVRARCAVHALVDIDAKSLAAQAAYLRLPPERCFSSIAAAFDAFEAGNLEGIDACFVVVPPAFHREAIERATRVGLAVLCEKPLAGSWDDCVATHDVVRRSGVKVQVVQNYRYWPIIQAAKSALSSDKLGSLHYLVCRFAGDYRRRDSWGGPFRHRMSHPVLVEAAAHHFDQARYLAGADFATIHAIDWKPQSVTGFDGECCALAFGSFANGARYNYEGSVVAAGTQSSWGAPYYRLECGDGAVIVAENRVSIVRSGHRGDIVEDVPLVPLRHSGHGAVLNQFFDWLDFGTEPETRIEDNLATAATVFAAIESAEKDCGVDVAKRVAAAR